MTKFTSILFQALTPAVILLKIKKTHNQIERKEGFQTLSLIMGFYEPLLATGLYGPLNYSTDPTVKLKSPERAIALTNIFIILNSFIFPHLGHLISISTCASELTC